MINLPKCAAMLRAVLIAVSIFALCSAGQAQTFTLTTPLPGSNNNILYMGIGGTISDITNATVTVIVKDNAGHAFSTGAAVNGSGWGTDFGISALIPNGSTSYNAAVTIQANVTGTKPGYPPSPVSLSAGPVTCTVQVGYILGASSGNTATVTAPTNGATIHLTPSGVFPINSDHHFDFFRYDTFGQYTPTVEAQLLTSWPNTTPLVSVQDQKPGFQLLQQTGDCYHDYNLSNQETYSGPLTGNFIIPFETQALSFYPVGNQIASGLTSANAVYP